MRIERPRAARYTFVASVTVTDLESGSQTLENTQNLSLFGCQITARIPTSVGTRVRVQIFYNRGAFEAQGRVVNIQSFGAAGITFTHISERHQQVLDKWIAELRKKALYSEVSRLPA